MLTPSFRITQDDIHVFISIHAPYTNIGDTDVDVDGPNFLFVSSPYFLRLHLPGRIVENEKSKGSYTCDTGDFNLTFDKETQGEHFDNLDMITSLLAPRDIPNINPDLVEVLEEDGILTDDNEDNTNEDSSKYTFGFANKVNDFSDIGREFPQIFELKVPEEVAISERNNLRQQYEEHKFSSDHYLADLFDTELIEPYLNNNNPFLQIDETKSSEGFTDDEVSILKDLPRKQYLLTPKEHTQVLMGLVDILYGYCYDKRTTLNEGTVESSWTINKLSSTLSWFCNFNDSREVLTACFRRALIYPIFRNFKLCEKVKQDLVSVLKKGKVFVIKCMIDIHQTFNTCNDARYILNQLFIKDYLVFLQLCKNEEFVELSNNVANIDISKNDLGLELLEFEDAASMVQQEVGVVFENEMALKLASMSLIPGLKKIQEAPSESSYETYSSDCSSDSSDSDSSSDSSDDSTDELDSDDEPDEPDEIGKSL